MESERAKRWLYSSTIIAAGFLVYVNAYWAGFLSLDDAGIMHIFSSKGYDIWTHLFSGAGSYFRPVTKLSLYLDFRLFGRNAEAMHMVNLVMHLCNGLLVYYLALELNDDGESREEAAFLAGLIFTLHPVNTEAVLWIAGRTDLLCAFFSLVALILIVRYFRTPTAGTIPLLFVMCLLALLAKEAAATLLLAVPLFCLLHLKRAGMRRTALAVSPFMAAAIVYFLLRMGPSASVDTGVAGVISGAKPQTSLLFSVVSAAGFYVQKMFYPFPLNFAIMHINKPLGVTVLAVSVTGAILFFRMFQEVRLPLLLMFTGIAPPLLAFVGKLPWTPYAERYLYLSMAGFSLVVAMVTVRYTPRSMLLVPVGLVSLLALTSMSRVVLWADPLAFWQSTLENSPEFHRAYVGVGYEYFRSGRYNLAEEYFDKAIAKGYKSDFLWDYKAAIALARKDYDGYEMAKLNAAGLAKEPTAIYRELAVTMMKIRRQQGDVRAGYRKAIHYYLTAYDHDRTYGEGLYNAGKLFWVMGENQRAMTYLEQFISLKGDNFYKPFAVKILKKIKAESAKGH